MLRSLVTVPAVAMRRFLVWLTIPRLTGIMIAIAVVSIVVDATTSVLHAWLPNIGIGAIAIAITAAVVEELIKRAERARVAKRVEYAEGRIDYAMLELINAVQADYLRWRPAQESVVGGNPVEILNRWAEGAGDLDARPALQPGTRPYILRAALMFAEEVERVAGEVREHVDQNLAVQMSALRSATRRAEDIDGATPIYATAIASSNTLAVELFRARLILQAARQFAEADHEIRGKPWPWFLVLDRGTMLH